MSELQGLAQRSALLLRLRAGAALLVSKGRLRVDARDLDLISGVKGAAPSVHLDSYILPALADLEAAAPSLHVELEIAREVANKRVRRVTLQARPYTVRRTRAA